LSFVRKYEGETVLVMANLSRYPQATSIDLSEYKGITPVEMFGLGQFHPITDAPYIVTLGPYSFYWLQLTSASEPVAMGEGIQAAPAAAYASKAAILPPRLIAKDLSAGWKSIMGGPLKAKLESDILPKFLKKQRWCSQIRQQILSINIKDW